MNPVRAGGPLALSVLVLWLAGCATTVAPSARVESASPSSGVYHRVQKGQTIWRIAQTYHVSLDDLTRSNQIPNAAYVEEGQLLLIPGATAVVDIPGPQEDPNKQEFIWPLKGSVVGYFGSGRGFLQKGIEIKAAPGQDIVAGREGRVVFADYLGGYAYTVIVDHQDGFHSVYALAARLTVRLGDHVLKGDTIAQLGPSDPLYFEIRKNGQASNPLHYLPR